MDKFEREAAVEQISLSLETGSPAKRSEPFHPWHSSADVERPLRCLVGELPGATVVPSRALHFVRNAEEPYDIIILPDGHDDLALEALMTRSSNPAAPIIAFDRALGPRVDRIVVRENPRSLQEAISGLMPLASRVSALPRIPLGTDRPGLLALALAYTRNSSIAPKWRPDRSEAIGYPLLVGIPQTRRILEELADAGLLRRRFFERLFVCEHCDSSRLHPREVCSACHSSNIAEHALVHHYACGTQAPQIEFEGPDGYRCPKCRKELRHYGVDYDKPGHVLVCGACGTTMAEPEVSFACLDCGQQTSSERAQRRDWFEYELTQDGIDALRAGMLPRTEDDASAGQRGRSLRDFTMVVGFYLASAARHGRPISGWRMTIAVDELVRSVGKPAANEVCRLVQEVAVAELRPCDAHVVLPAGLAVCLPETSSEEASAQVRAVTQKIEQMVRLKVRTKFSLYERPQIEALLKELRGNG